MQNDYNSIYFEKYNTVRSVLDKINKETILRIKKLKDIDDIHLMVCALFVGVKSEEYIDQSILFLNLLLKSFGVKKIIEVMQSNQIKSYKINSLDILPEKRVEIIKYMFTKIEDDCYYFGVVFLLGFYLTPEVVNLLKEYQKSESAIVKKEAEAAINFISKKLQEK